MKPRADVSALAHASRELLNQGDPIGAERVLAPVFNQLKSDVAVLHLMGLIKKAQNQLGEAERYLRGAIASSLSEGAYYNDLGVVLQARGEFIEAARVFRAAIALMPDAGAPRVNLVRCLMASGELAEAERDARAYIAVIPGAESWTLLGVVQRAQERYQDALASADQALRYQPRARGLRHNRAIALDRLGRSKDALAQFEQLAQEDIDSPELAVNFARALYLEQRAKDAEQVLEQCVALWPHAAPIQTTLARIRFLAGGGANSTAAMEAAIEQRPGDVSLILLCADALHRAGFTDKARRVLEKPLRAGPVPPAIAAALGVVLDDQGHSEQGLELMRKAAEASGGAPQTHRAMIAPLLRLKRADEVLALVRGLRRSAPQDQYLIACEATALRIMGDPAYQRLYDYERLVRIYDIPPPKGFFTAENFNASLADSLRVELGAAHPLDQTLRHGSQTGRDLRHVDEPNIREFIAALDAPIRSYLAELSDRPEDPVGRRKQEHYRLAGCWATRLSPGGVIANHVHDHGWISSAYYASVPEQTAREDLRAGWLKLGEPHWEIPGCPPERTVQPRAGMLVLFPSYMWHGSTLFSEGEERLSVAFDVVPA